MLKPIPSALLKDVATFHYPVSMDKWQKPVYDDVTVANVHIQPTNATKKTVTNEEIVLRAVLFVDCKKSLPAIDLMSMQEAAQAIGANILVTVTDYAGHSVNYTVQSIDALPDVPAIRTHHYEVGLI